MIRRIVVLALMALALSALSAQAAVSPQASRSVRGALSPSAPVRLDYELPETLPASGEMTLALTLSSPMPSGRLVFEIVRSEGISVMAGATTTFTLGPEQAFAHTLQLVLGGSAERYLIVQVGVDGPQGVMSRSYRIDLNAASAAPAAAQPTLKLLPATQPR